MISIVIIVKNSRSVDKLISDLIKIEKPEKSEIIVVDASKKELLIDIKEKYSSVKWIYYVSKKPKKVTIPEQRNLGIKKSGGDIIVFIDADCSPNKDWLIELIRPIREGGENFVAGLVTSREKKQLHKRNWKKRGDVSYLSECGTANTAFKKSILSSGIEFDETFDYGSDTEFSWRIIKKGYKIRYVQNAVIYLDWGGINEEKKRALKYGQARVRLYRKHPDQKWRLFKYNEDLFTIYSLIFFFYIISIIPITFIWRFYPLFIFVPLLKNLDKKVFKKLIFDFYWAIGVLGEYFLPTIKNGNFKK